MRSRSTVLAKPQQSVWRRSRKDKRRSRTLLYSGGFIAVLMLVGVSAWFLRTLSGDSGHAKLADVDQPAASSIDPLEFEVEAPLPDTVRPQTVAEVRELDIILQRYAAAHGGEKAMNAVHSFRLRGEIRSEEGSVQFDQMKRVPNMARTTIEVDGRSVTDIYDGKTAWRRIEGVDEAYLLKGAMASDVAEAAPIYNALWRERANPEAYQVMADAELDGERCLRVQVQPNGSAPEVYWLNSETGLERQIVTESESGVTVTRFREYFASGNIQIPGVTHITYPDGREAEIIIEEAQLNPGVLSFFFQAPRDLKVWPQTAVSDFDR
ncbi:hypothetical protein [Cerasicoccus maritimus]|uniref:hypothetical protein n=1 Tax=Cerasicoccus maritimus TaxID=490089 RepID=UPI0028527146|nr:hypothetical protein [Cerasicoccus maritimus]